MRELVYSVVLALLLALQATSIAAGQYRGLELETPGGETLRLYSGSYALLVGNSNYEHWDKLEWPTTDVDDVATQLERVGFETEVHKNLTKQGFLDAMSRFQSTRGKDPDAQLLIYYAGHGHTMKGGALGQSFGYIVLTDTPNPSRDDAGFEARSIGMDWFITYARKIAARHVLFVFDSCFSGSVLNVRSETVPRAIAQSIAKPVREFLTAGSADEPVPDRSIFKSVLVKVLEGSIEEPIADGYLTGDELGLLMKTEVPKYYPNQHPQYGKILDPNLDEGDFVFKLAREKEAAAVDAAFEEGEQAYRSGNYATALSALQPLADAGHAEAMTYIGSMYMEGLGVGESKKDAAEWFLRAAEAGSPSAMNNIAYLYSEGIGVEQDHFQAAFWYGQAVSAGETSAMYNLGSMYRLGLGVKQDYRKAFANYRSAAEAGDARAMNDLAFLLHKGLGVKQSGEQALKWYRRAVDAGEANAMYNLGRLYIEGEIVARDVDEALRLFRAGAGRGHPGCMNGLGVMLIDSDPERAFAWFERAALQDYPAAMFHLARMHEQGQGTAADRETAIEWYRRAAAKGDELAIARLAELGEELGGTSPEAAKQNPFSERDGMSAPRLR